MGTLSKALGVFGAYVVGSQALVDYLANRARGFVFSTALPPSIAAAAGAAVVFARGCAGEELREALLLRMEQFSRGLAALGILAQRAGRTPIYPIFIGDDRKAMEATEALLERGVFAQGIRPPTVATGTARLRFSLMATHTADDVALALGALADLVRGGVIPRSTP
jgi:7-keto-8-aminopelargonate synthetase-like enzyme